MIKRRAGNLHAESFNPLGPVPCKDGWVCLGVASLPQWEGLCLALDLPELLVDERFQTGGDRFDHADQLAEVLDPVLMALTADEVVARCEEHRVPAGPVLRVSQALDEEQLAVRGFWASSTRIGGGARMPERPFRVPGADAPFREAPAYGEHTARGGRQPCPSARARHGGRPSDDAEGRAGAGLHHRLGGSPRREMAGRSRCRGDPCGAPAGARASAPPPPAVSPPPKRRSASGTGVSCPARPSAPASTRTPMPGEHPWNRQGVYNKMQRNKLGLCLDLKAPDGRDVLIDLVRVSDVVLDNYSPRGSRSMGLDYEALLPYKPDLIRVAMSGYGYTGPDQMRPSWGPILEAHSGMAWASGYEDGGPMKVGVALPDPTGGLHAVVAILAALDERDRTGRGCYIDLSQLETYASLGGEKYLSASATGEEPPRWANRSADRAPQGVYPCQGEEEWLAISVETDEEWARAGRRAGPGHAR